MLKYHYVTVSIVMRDCDNVEDAKKKCERLLPYKPDENSKHMESWEIVNVDEHIIRGTIRPEDVEFTK